MGNKMLRDVRVFADLISNPISLVRSWCFHPILEIVLQHGNHKLGCGVGIRHSWMCWVRHASRMEQQTLDGALPSIKFWSGFCMTDSGCIIYRSVVECVSPITSNETYMAPTCSTATIKSWDASMVKSRISKPKSFTDHSLSGMPFILHGSCTHENPDPVDWHKTPPDNCQAWPSCMLMTRECGKERLFQACWYSPRKRRRPGVSRSQWLPSSNRAKNSSIL